MITVSSTLLFPHMTGKLMTALIAVLKPEMPITNLAHYRAENLVLMTVRLMHRELQLSIWTEVKGKSSP